VSRPGWRGRAVRGTFIHAPVRGEIEVLADAILRLDDEGRIETVARAGTEAHGALAAAPDLIVLPADRFVIPGFVDLHVHAPQYPQLGQALDVPLEVWLGKYTFPLEARYAELDFARERYEVLVADLLAAGTTTALYFATQHLKATELLAEICLAQGQRGLVGKVAMDDPAACPEYYRDASAAAAVADTRDLIAFVRALPGQ
jgi:guanine deaminase